MNNADFIAQAKNTIGKEYYDLIESMSLMFKAKVKLKKSEKWPLGTVIGLWLPRDEEVLRKNDLWLVEWENGNTGLIEERDVEIIKN